MMWKWKKKNWKYSACTDGNICQIKPCNKQTHKKIK